MERNQLQGNAVCRLLTGKQGIGKTTFVKSFITATSKTCQNVLAIYADYSQLLDFVPSQIIYAACKIYGLDVYCETPDELSSILEILLQRNIRVFLV